MMAQGLAVGRLTYPRTAWCWCFDSKQKEGALALKPRVARESAWSESTVAVSAVCSEPTLLLLRLHMTTRRALAQQLGEG